MKGKIYLRPLAKNETEMIMFAHIDPKGKIPKWVVNLFQKSWPRKYFRSIEKNAGLKQRPLKPGIEKLLSKLERLLMDSPEKVVSLEKSPIYE